MTGQLALTVEPDAHGYYSINVTAPNGMTGTRTFGIFPSRDAALQHADSQAERLRIDEPVIAVKHLPDRKAIA